MIAKTYKFKSKNGLDCKVVRRQFNVGGEGWYCGYVAIPKNIIPSDMGYYDIPVNVHGGLTFADYFSSEDVTWYGFDCHHFGDEHRGWTRQKVKDEIESLAIQLMALKLK